PGPKAWHAVIDAFCARHVVCCNAALLHCCSPVFYALVFPGEPRWKVGDVSGCIYAIPSMHVFINNHASVVVQLGPFEEVSRGLDTDTDNHQIRLNSLLRIQSDGFNCIVTVETSGARAESELHTSGLMSLLN